MRLFLQAIGLALIVIGLLSVLFWGLTPAGIAFPIGATLVWLTRKKPTRTVASDGVGLTFPRNGVVMPTYPAAPYSGRSSSSSRSSPSSSTTRRDDSYVDPLPYMAYSSSYSSSSIDCSSSDNSGSSSSYDSGSSSSDSGGSCGGGD